MIASAVRRAYQTRGALSLGILPAVDGPTDRTWAIKAPEAFSPAHGWSRGLFTQVCVGTGRRDGARPPRRAVKTPSPVMCAGSPPGGGGRGS
jgi:hypothetical protein